MKTVFLILSTLWTVARKTPTMLSLLLVFARCTPAILRQLPAAFVLIGKIRAAFGSEAVRELLKALYAFIDQMSPPTPAVDGDTHDNTKEEQRRRRFLFRKRLKFASVFNDDTVEYVCDLHDRTAGADIDGVSIDGLPIYQYV